MTDRERILAFIAYLPVIGWIYVWFTHRSHSFAVFHLRQSVGLFLFVAGVFAGWVVIGWVLAWLPYMVVFSMALFALVMAAVFFGVIAWLVGIANAFNGRVAYLPMIGEWANKLPLR
ncbi:MAG: hypothetical protein ROW39_00245 [Anaerolineaceae bacterium]|jgi:uncharacterized membrane protein